MFERHGEREEVGIGVLQGPGYLLYKTSTPGRPSFPMLRKMGAKLDELEETSFVAARADRATSPTPSRDHNFAG